MMVVRAGTRITDDACRAWSEKSLSSTRSGPGKATIDAYAARVSAGPGLPAAEEFERTRDRLFAYAIFPPGLLKARIYPTPRITEGATVVQRLVLGPVALEMAVRVVDAWDRASDDERYAGFTYVTLAGHAECGVESFAVRLESDGRVRMQIDARSRPGSMVTRIGYPVARAIQRGMTRAALRRLRVSR